MTTIVKTWDRLTVAQRRKILLDTMPEERWRNLVERMSHSSFKQLTPLQQDGIPEFLKRAK